MPRGFFFAIRMVEMEKRPRPYEAGRATEGPYGKFDTYVIFWPTDLAWVKR
jgi:hypothetical protein